MKITPHETHPVVDCFVRVTVLQVKWIHNKCLGQFELVFHPEERTVEINEHPLVWIDIEGRCVLREEIN